AYPGFPERIELICRQATAVLAGTSLEVYFHDGRRAQHGEDLDVGTAGAGADPMAFPHHWHRGLIEDFLDAIEQGREPAASGEEALKVHRLIDALLDSAAA